MSSFSAGTSFSDGVANDVTAAKLGALINNATPTSGLIQDRTAETITATNDTLLMGDASDSNNLKRITVANFAQTLPTAKITTGTIEDATLGTTTGTAATFTTGTIPTLTAGTTTSTAATITTGTIPTLSATTLLTVGTGTASAPAITVTGDTNNGLFFPAADTIAATTNGTERLRIDSSGNVGIGTTSPASKLHISGSSGTGSELRITSTSVNSGGKITFYESSSSAHEIGSGGANNYFYIKDLFNNAERLRITSSGAVCVGKTATDFSAQGVELTTSESWITRNGGLPFGIRRNTDDGNLVSFYQDSSQEGTISVSGTTVSYNGGHLARFSQLQSGQRDLSIKKGTVLSNLDEMCEWRDKDGNLLPNEQLNRVKVSDVDGDYNVAGVFVNWDNDDQDNPFDLNMAMTGDMIIRIAKGVTINRGDLLMSAGDGTAKPQGDDILKSKTIAKVTSTNVTCTYDDGSYCVPCVLMAC